MVLFVFRMFLYVTTAVAACLGVSFINPTVFTFLLLALLTTIVIFASVSIVVWVHIRLSSRHLATVGAEHSLKGIENFRITLMVNDIVFLETRLIIENNRSLGKLSVGLNTRLLTLSGRCLARGNVNN